MRIPANAAFIALLHPAIRVEAQQLIEFAESTLMGPDLGICITYSLRTIDEQNGIYAQGRTKPGPIVTDAKGGQSFHNYGLAFDFCWAYLNASTGKFLVSDETAWAVGPIHHKVTSLFVSKGWEWGGVWHTPDDPHLEKRFGYAENCSTLYQKYLAKDFIPGTGYINL